MGYGRNGLSTREKWFQHDGLDSLGELEMSMPVGIARKVERHDVCGLCGTSLRGGVEIALVRFRK